MFYRRWDNSANLAAVAAAAAAGREQIFSHDRLGDCFSLLLIVVVVFGIDFAFVRFELDRAQRHYQVGWLDPGEPGNVQWREIPKRLICRRRRSLTQHLKAYYQCGTTTTTTAAVQTIASDLSRLVLPEPTVGPADQKLRRPKATCTHLKH